MRIIVLFAIFGGLLFQSPTVPAQEPPKKLALLVGVADYFNKRLSDLDYADADVIAVGKELKRLGFEVTLLTEKRANHKSVSTAIERFIEQSSGLESESIVFMMFSGHGQELTDARIPFYLPRDAKPYDLAKDMVEGKSEEELAAEFRLIPLNKLIQDINSISNSSNNLLIFDACRNDPGSGKSSGVTTKITRNVENGTSILFSATSGQRSWESSDVGHGVMSHFLIEGLRGHARNRRNMITWQNLVTHVRESVSYDAGKLAGGSDRLQSPHAIINQNATIVLGTIGAIDYSGADFDRIKSDAFLNYKDAQYHLGLRYLNADGIDKDLLEAERWFTKASDEEHMAARTQLGLLLRDSYTTPEKAIELFKSAAQSGEPIAQLELGKAFRDGEHVTKDYKQALQWFLKAAKQGNAEAQNQVGIRYESGQGTVENDVEAVKWYKKSAENGYDWGQYNLAKCFLNGRGTGKNLSAAFRWFERAAAKGHSKAQYQLGIAYRDGDGVPKNSKQAFGWFLKAAESGVSDAQNQVGISYESGKGVSKDAKKGFEWYKKSARSGNDWAQYNLGLCYQSGSGVAKNLVTAFQWFKKSADQGNSRAQNQVGLCYDKGEGVKQNDAEAFSWYKKSAENGYDWGQYNLGVFYTDGRGTAKNATAGMNWYQKAAAQGNASAKKMIPVKVGRAALELAGKDLNGSQMSLSDNRGKIVLLDFWNPG